MSGFYGTAQVDYKAGTTRSVPSVEDALSRSSRDPRRFESNLRAYP